MICRIKSSDCAVTAPYCVDAMVVSTINTVHLCLRSVVWLNRKVRAENGAREARKPCSRSRWTNRRAVRLGSPGCDGAGLRQTRLINCLRFHVTRPDFLVGRNGAVVTTAVGRTGFPSTSSIWNACTRRARTDVASAIANCAPKQTQGPAPNGRYENRVGGVASGRNRPGSNAFGFDQCKLCRCSTHGLIMTSVPRTILSPSISSGMTHWRVSTHTGGYRRNASLTMARV